MAEKSKFHNIYYSLLTSKAFLEVIPSLIESILSVLLSIRIVRLIVTRQNLSNTFSPKKMELSFV